MARRPSEPAGFMTLLEHIAADQIDLALNAADKTGAITALVDRLSRLGRITQRDAVLRAVLDREAQRSTGLGRGFALPHAKTDAVRQLLIAFGRPTRPLSFDAPDGQPVDLIALLLSPVASTAEHISALAQLNRLALNAGLRERLARAATANEFYQLLREVPASR